MGKTNPSVCGICGNTLVEELNFEAKIHHGADRIECIDRKACKKRKKKKK